MKMHFLGIAIVAAVLAGCGTSEPPKAPADKGSPPAPVNDGQPAAPDEGSSDAASEDSSETTTSRLDGSEAPALIDPGSQASTPKTGTPKTGTPPVDPPTTTDDDQPDAAPAENVEVEPAAGSSTGVGRAVQRALLRTITGS